MKAKKQTAVQSLMGQMECRLKSLPQRKFFEQALAIEKEQIMDAFRIGMDMWVGYTPEQYYNETYGK